MDTRQIAQVRSEASGTDTSIDLIYLNVNSWYRYGRYTCNSSSEFKKYYKYFSFFSTNIPVFSGNGSYKYL